MVLQNKEQTLVKILDVNISVSCKVFLMQHNYKDLIRLRNYLEIYTILSLKTAHFLKLFVIRL